MGKAVTFGIEPSIGVARVGDSLTEFYLAPETIGGRPIACDEFGNTTSVGGAPVPVETYKDALMRIKRQGARFKVMRYDDAAAGAGGTEVVLGDADVTSIEWTVHVANKKAAWYGFSQLLGNTWYSGTYDPTNSYEARGIAFRNANITGSARQQLIIDPGPRTLSGSQVRAAFSRNTIPSDYPHGTFPNGHPSQGYPIDSLGDAVTDKDGRLVVIGAYGRAGGDLPISSYAGADTWFDDIADGPVSCKLTLSTGEVHTLTAWVIVGSPKYVPELVNITTLDDIVYDVGVRYHNLDPNLYTGGAYNSTYQASYEDDIRPILERMASYQWVANTQAMTAAAAPGFDLRDPGSGNRANRESLLAQFRGLHDTQTLWAANQAPAMPLNSGTNSVTNELLVKFSTLTTTQYFLLSQWAAGLFTAGSRSGPPRVSVLDRAGPGNSVGEPVSPGVEVTWSLRNPTLYDRPYHIKHRHDEAYYRANGLDPNENETVPTSPTAVVGLGCEPGDLTKRMAIPWHADFFLCTMQYVNFTDENVNKVNGIPLPPTYYSYWWPPQSPWNVISGPHDAAEQAATGVPAGVQVDYARGINSFIDMITGWKYLAFVHNQATGEHRLRYPYFVEVERNNDRFSMGSVAVGGISNVTDATNTTFMPVWFLREKDDAEGQHQARRMRAVGVQAVNATASVTEVIPRPITAHPNLGLPRNGRVMR